jgi:hypothetical protein
MPRVVPHVNLRRHPLLLSMLLAAVALSALGRSSDAAGAPDPAARGLDLFLHVPANAPPRGLVPVQVEAIGFPTAVTTQPLANVTIEAVWNPEHLGANVSAAPPVVRAKADASGRAHLDVPVPDGDEMELELLVGVRSGAHARTRTVKVKRVRPYDVALFVPDRRVVPGSTISAWVLVTSALSGSPVPEAPLTLTLGEGGVPRFRTDVVTDVSGTAMARIPIPISEEPTWTWHLSAAARLGAFGAGEAGVELMPREETPGKPQLHVSWIEDSVLAGDVAHFALRVRDASDQPVTGQALRYWIGPRGTEPPKEAVAWEKVATRAVTNPSGEVLGEASTPATVVTGVGTQLRIVARGEVDGRELTSQATVTVGAPAAEATLTTEGDRVVPGLEQRVLLTVHDGKGKPVVAPFRVDADGLLAHVRTDMHGEAEVSWRAPLDVGAMRQTGPCAGGVAAAVTVRPEAPVPELSTHPDPFELCVKVDRDATSLVRADRTLVRAGEQLHVRVLSSDAKPAGGRGARRKGPWSLVATNRAGTSSVSAWIEDGEAGGDLAIPVGASGVWSLAAVSPGGRADARVTAGAVLVVPPVLPKLTAKMTGGRAAPGGAIDLEAVLTDGAGRGMPGSVSAIMIDRHGGGSIGGLGALDTRHKLCSSAGADDDRCDAFVEGAPALEPLRRALLAGLGVTLAPQNDPEGRMLTELRDAFRDVVHSLEGAVFEAARSPEQLRDVRRRGADGTWQWNPELMTLVTAAMEPKPVTPGGEPLTLGDLFAIDGQVTFGNVARRITRLKLFRVLAEMRRFKLEKSLDADEPALKDPNAMLRRLVRDARLEEEALIDPWGGSLRFVQTQQAPVPFLTVARGWELRAPGPDGQAGTADDVKDPFERVLKSGSPYAVAVQEDRIVDAKWDMEVAETTVSAWQTMFEELTGTKLGEGGGGTGSGIGLGGIGSGVGGSGHGFGSGSGRLSVGNPSGVAFWSPPIRTDKNGRAVIRVPLGDIETTWRIALVGVPDGATPATASVDVASELPLAAHVDAGTRWIVGDSVDAVVTVRSRAKTPTRATLTFAAGGVLELVGGGRELAVDIPANGVTTTRVRARARRAGTAELAVTTRAPGLPDDLARHSWEVRRAGEAVDVSHVQWVEGEVELTPWLDPKPYEALGPARVVLERGVDVSLASALEALDPDRLRSARELADAIEVASRLRAWGTARGGEDDPIVVRATTIQRRATGRLAAYVHLPGAPAFPAVTARAAAFAAPGEAGALPKAKDCPEDAPAGDLLAAVDGLDAEPAPMAGGVASCWDAYVSTVMDDVDRSADPEATARALLALADRPHRAARAHETAARLEALVGRSKREPGAEIKLPPGEAHDRGARATVYAGLVRAASLDRTRAAELPRLVAAAAVQRDQSGGYGASGATRAVVRAILAASPPPSTGRIVVRVVVDGTARDLDVPATGVAALTLPEGAKTLTLEAKGIIARLERPGLRPWTLPAPGEPHGPLHAEITWPASARAGRTGLLRVAVRNDAGHATTVDVRLPLPPGVTLAEPIPNVRQVQGVLAIRRTLDGGRLPNVVEVPIRFLLAGSVTVPETVVRYAFDAGPRVVVPARPFSVASP